MLNADIIQKQSNLLTNKRFIIKQICPTAYKHSYDIIYVDNNDVSLHTLPYKKFKRLCKKVYVIIQHRLENISRGSTIVGKDFKFYPLIIKGKHYIRISDVAKYIDMNSANFYNKIPSKILSLYVDKMPNDCKFLFNNRSKLSFVNVTDIYLFIKSLFHYHIFFIHSKALNLLNVIRKKYFERVNNKNKSGASKLYIDPINCKVSQMSFNNKFIGIVTAHKHKNIIHVLNSIDISKCLNISLATVYEYLKKYTNIGNYCICIKGSILRNRKFIPLHLPTNQNNSRFYSVKGILKFICHSNLNNTYIFIKLRNKLIKTFPKETEKFVIHHHLQYLLHHESSINLGQKMDNIVKKQSNRNNVNKRLLKLEKDSFSMNDVNHEIKLALKKNNKKNINKFESQIYYLKQQIKQLKAPWYKKVF